MSNRQRSSARHLLVVVLILVLAAGGVTLVQGRTHHPRPSGRRLLAASNASTPIPGLDTAVVGPDQAVWVNGWDGQGWTSWYSIGGVATSSVAEVSFFPGRLDLFVRGPDGSLYQQWSQGGQWSGWVPLGGQIVGAPAVVSMAPGRLDVFVRDTANHLEHMYWVAASGWSGWETLGGTLTSSPTAASWGGRIDVFVRGPDNGIWQLFWLPSTGWVGWYGLGGLATSDPSAAAWGGPRIDVAVRGADGQLYQLYWDSSGWHGWYSLGGTLTSSPALASWGPGQLSALVRGPDNGLWSLQYGSNGWTRSWRSVGGQLASGPSAGIFTAATSNTIPSVPYDQQQYELSCEEASFQMALAHQNISVSQAQELADEGVDSRAGYFSGSVLYWGDPYSDFVGNPNGSEIALTGYGTYWNVIERIGGGYGANMLAASGGISPQQVYSAVLQNHPVVAWVTFDWTYHAVTNQWDAFDGRTLGWSGPVEHTVTVVGVNASSVYVYNPWYGPQWIAKSTFEASYGSYGDMAVIGQ